MTKKGRKSRSYNKNIDVTIKEFADSQTCTNRVKKGILTVTEDLFDLNANIMTDDEDVVIKKTKSSKSNPNDPLDNHIFSNYPVDFWYLISNHIRPEDIGRFSLICKTTAEICGKPSFWFSLYKRHYKTLKEDIIPIRLQPDCMVRLHNLRACVIRSLFFTYEPYVERLPSLAKQDFHNLKSFWVKANWIDTNRNDWLFCYKLRCDMTPDRTVRSRDSSLLSNQRNIFYNTEQGCKLLVITTKKFCPLPDLRGNTSYVLYSINHTLTTNLRDYKLTLIFSNYQKQMVHSTVQTVVYDPVSHVEVLDWWTPAYNEFVK